ncbi:hypothetical protein [Demequina phytophila]|uniref:hypothetical protein n=1 Tax=Demequina phytophila TaxID=1638981 RepID=UPI000784F658|nr:hypothetical protein [Demequina phytophila]
MGAGFVLTGLLLALTLTAAAILRWSAKPWHAVGLAAAAMATTVTVSLTGAFAAPPTGPGEALLTATAEEPQPEDGDEYFFTARSGPVPIPMPDAWLAVAGDGVHASVPWPVDTGGAVVTEGVPTAVGLDTEVLADYYASIGQLDRDGDTFLVETRSGWTAEVELSGGVLTVTFP